MPYGGCQNLWLALGLRSDWLEATQLLLWRDGACPHLGIQAAVCVRLLVVGLAQAEAACAPPPGASFPHRVSPELHLPAQIAAA